MKERSYSEIMRASVMKQKQSKKTFVMDIYIDMLISEINLNVQKEKLLNRIDQAIDEKDRESFLSLTEELKYLNKKFGT
ncbi:IDEAL domain-containing protein [Mesobacillus harenae]|uniref:IDEAL domain-containing protein n=1 Tax=Mesobacillus harenae TaxID=2213203 RepID=UPI00157FE6EF|nr:IDEAL domain-containing protein [Mesobacillus harenae]